MCEQPFSLINCVHGLYIKHYWVLSVIAPHRGYRFSYIESTRLSTIPIRWLANMSNSADSRAFTSMF